MSEFDEYQEKNPRECIPNSMNDFLAFAKKKYARLQSVNMTHPDEDEMEEEVQNYIGDSMEALLLYKEYLGGLKK
jgi:hypothetical protein